MDIVIEPLQATELEPALVFIQSVIEDNFVYEGKRLGDVKEVIENEMQSQRVRLETSLKDPSVKVLLAKHGVEIVGTAGFYYPGPTLAAAEAALDEKYPKLCELVSVYIKPEYQRQGLGSKLVAKTIELLKKSSYQYVGLSTGYKKGLAFWLKKFGEPTVVLLGYYNNRVDCNVWILKIKEL